MRGRLSILLLLLWLCTLGMANADTLGGVTFTPPAGWSRTESTENGVTLAPPGEEVQVILTRSLPSGSDPRKLFDLLAATFMEGSVVVSSSEVATSTAGDGSTVLARGYVTQPTRPVILLLKAKNGVAAAVQYSALNAAAQSRYQAQVATLVETLTLPASVTSSGTGQGGSLPAVKPMNAAQFVAAGGDPEQALIPDEFRCYYRGGGDSLTPELVVQVLGGGAYRSSLGSGRYSMRLDGSFMKVAWNSGPLAGEDGETSYLDFDDFGQSFSASGIGADGRNYECYQRGGKEDRMLAEFRLKTPKPGSYPCLTSDGSNKAAGTLELLAGGVYRLGGQGGRYTLDFRLNQNHDWSDLNFTGGLLDDAGGSYEESAAGRRAVTVSSPKLECVVVAKPTTLPTLGTAKAPPPPPGSGGLSGAYLHWYAATLVPNLNGGLDLPCGGICIRYYFFFPSGYVYTQEPEGSASEADCTRTHPNGLPVCEVYRVSGNTIVIGKGKPISFRKTASGLQINGNTVSALPSMNGVTLSGSYQARSVVNAVVGTGGASFQYRYTFDKSGHFSYGSEGGGFFGGTDTGTSSGNVTAGVGFSNARSSSGTYTFSGNTPKLNYSDGRVVTLFALLLPGDDGKPQRDVLRIGGRTFYLEDGKK